MLKSRALTKAKVRHLFGSNAKKLAVDLFSCRTSTPKIKRKTSKMLRIKEPAVGKEAKRQLKTCEVLESTAARKEHKKNSGVLRSNNKLLNVAVSAVCEVDYASKLYLRAVEEEEKLLATKFHKKRGRLRENELQRFVKNHSTVNSFRKPKKIAISEDVKRLFFNESLDKIKETDVSFTTRCLPTQGENFAELIGGTFETF